MIRAKLAGNREMLVLDNDTGISEELITKGHHEPRCTSFMVNTVLKPGQNVLEIGANIGYFALIESELVGNDGHVYAVEPVPDNIRCLKENIKEYGIKNLTTFELAIGNKKEKVTMRLAQFSNSGTLTKDDEVAEGYRDWFNGWHTHDITVQQIRLDSFIEENNIPTPDLIRMDVEGYETEVIRGGKKTLKTMPVGSTLFIELHPVVFKEKYDTTLEMLKTLYDNGFKPVWCEGETEFPKDLEEFTEYVCREEAHCPHVFFEKV